MAVHSLKDSPAVPLPGLVLAACLPREDVRDVLIAVEAKGLGQLVPGSSVGTSSGRRRAQLLHAYPHLQVIALRGNIDTRLEKIRNREMGATIMAAAGLKRLGAEQHAGLVSLSLLSTEEMLPAACQGAIGIMCREDNEQVLKLLSNINHQPTLLEVAAERACLAALLGEEGVAEGSSMPAFAVAVHAQYDADERAMDLDCLVSDLDGKDLFRYTEFQRPVEAVEQAMDLGELYGGILRHMASSQGWLAGDN